MAFQKWIFLGFLLIGVIACKSKSIMTKTIDGPVEKAEVAQEEIGSQSTQERPRQGRGQFNPENDPEYLAMLDSMQMNQEQKMHFDIINKAYRDKMVEKRRAARESGKGMQSIREEMMKMRSEQEGAIKNLLTQSQYKIYTEYLEKRRKERESRRGQRGS